MRALYYVLLMMFLAGQACPAQSGIPFSLRNPLDVPRNQEVVIITRAQYLARTSHIPTTLLPQACDSAGHPIPTQADDLNGDCLWDEIAILVSLGPNQTAKYTLSMVSPEQVTVFPQTTRAWLAPYVMTSDSTGEYREVKWARITYDSARSIYAQYQMGGMVLENQKEAHVYPIAPHQEGEAYRKLSASEEKIGPADNYHSVQFSSLIYRDEPTAGFPSWIIDSHSYRLPIRYWRVCSGPVRSIGYLFFPGADDYERWEIQPAGLIVKIPWIGQLPRKSLSFQLIGF